jgi:hypothetical protein
VIKARYRLGLTLLCITVTGFGSAGAMGLRSLVALPVDKGGSVVRLTLESADKANTDHLITNVAYGISADKTLLFGLPYRIEPDDQNRTGDLSVLYRHIGWREDNRDGTNRLGLLIGALLPSQTDDSSAVQAGLVFTHYKTRNEIDSDLLYRFGEDDRLDSARYDISWQYRLRPGQRPAWGLVPELNTVLELNGRWLEDEDVVHQVTAGLQWILPQWVFEGGIARDISNGSETRLILSTRFHF